MSNKAQRKYSYIIFLSSLLMMIASSCALPPDLTHKECISPPPPECRPGVSTTVGIDTVHLQPGYIKWHIDLLPKPINSNGNENAISFSHNGAMLSTEREKEGETRQRIFFSTLRPDLHFDDLTELFDTEKFENIGTPVYCQADARLYFTAKAKNDDPNDYDIYSANMRGSIDKDGKATNSIFNLDMLPELNKLNCFDAQPALSQDGLMIIFTSDRAGGNGGTDLWYSTRSSTKREWQEPKMLPPEINSPCNELSPSFSEDGKRLYFSSDGHETIGGYDIFSSTFANGSWSKAENIGSPINTKFDEIFPYQLSDSQFFYTSDQPCEFKGRNIFVLRRTYIPPKEIVKKLPDSIQLKGKVEMPQKRDSVLPEVFVRDVEKNKEIARKRTDTLGNYSFNVEKDREYDVGSDVKDKFYDVHRIDLRHPSDSIVIVPPLVIPDTLVLRINFPFDDDSHPYDFIVDDKGGKTEMNWQTSIDLLAKSIKNSSSTLQSVILYGHTDSLGTDEYNNALAQRRAAFVAKELKTRGIPATLLVILSKGRTMPVSRQSGESDEIFQLRNRRVEFVKFFTKENQR